jgi:hypothetical protein
MSSIRPVFRALAASSILFIVPLQTARAADPNEVAGRLKAVLAEQGVDIAWTGVSGDGSTMVLSGVTAGAGGSGEQAKIGDVTLKDVTEKDGGYVIGTLDFPTYNVTEDGSSLEMVGAEMSGLRLPAAGSTDPLASVMMYDKARIDSVSVKHDGAEVFKLANFHVDITQPDGDKLMTFAGAAEGFSADLSKLDDPKAQATVQALGYENIDGKLALSGSWSPKTGDASLDQYSLTVNHAGTLKLSVKMGGYTPQFMKSLREMQKKMAAAPEGEKSGQSMAMLGLLQQLSFDHATISFEDDSLTGKVMDFVAAQQGMQRSDVANQAKAVLPFALAKLNNPQFTAEVTAAVSTFLDNPKSLTISAAPPAPLPFAILAAGAMAAPQQLPQTLGVKVIANQ